MHNNLSSLPITVQLLQVNTSKSGEREREEGRYTRPLLLFLINRSSPHGKLVAKTVYCDPLPGAGRGRRMGGARQEGWGDALLRGGAVQEWEGGGGVGESGGGRGGARQDRRRRGRAV